MLDLYKILFDERDSKSALHENEDESDRKDSSLHKFTTYFHEINMQLLDYSNVKSVESKSLIYKVKILISVGNLKTAAKLISNTLGSPYLALMLLSCAGNSKRQKMMREQIQIWHNAGALESFDPTIVELCMIIGGMTRWQSRYFNFSLSSDLVWTQSLILFATFRCDSTFSIDEVVQRFIDCFDANLGVEGQEDCDSLNGMCPDDMIFRPLPLYASNLSNHLFGRTLMDIS